MNPKNVLSYMGTFLQVNGIILLIPAIVAVVYNESIAPFIISGFLSFISGTILALRKKEELTFGDAMFLSAATLASVSLFGAMPFFMTLEGPPVQILIDGYFESVSGYTTTGLSIIPDLNGFPRSILFVRGMAQWIGGIGIVVLSFSMLVHGTSTLYLYKEEHKTNRILPSVKESAKLIIKIYIFYTLCGAILLWLSGLDWYTAITDILCALSTGGFSFTDYIYTNWMSKLIIIGAMLFGSMAFVIHYDLLSGNIKKVLSNIELRMLVAILIFTIPLFAIILLESGSDLAASIDGSVFNVISALTTTGYSSIDMASISEFGKLIISFLMIIGGSAGSTAGGIKLIRFVILLRATWWLTRKSSLSERAILPLKIGKEVLERKEVIQVAIFFFMYSTILITCTMVLTLYNYTVINSFFVSASALGTVGLSTINIPSLPLFPKIVLTIEMLLGRVEIISVLIFFGYISKRLRENYLAR